MEGTETARGRVSEKFELASRQRRGSDLVNNPVNEKNTEGGLSTTRSKKRANCTNRLYRPVLGHWGERKKENQREGVMQLAGTLRGSNRDSAKGTRENDNDKRYE